MSLGASNPRQNASVSASAGTGKTWLLVARMVRLLLDGARPDGLLAITFTRKAAAEMQTRLRERLRELVTVDDDTLVKQLAAVDAPTDASTRLRARQLYESLLRAPHPPRITTFHAFCHDILRRFPLDADITPGFELLENTAGLIQDALDALYAEATAAPDGTVGRALEQLSRLLGATKSGEALVRFIELRGDWWAFTRDATEPIEFATRRVIEQLGVDPAADPQAEFLARWSDELAEFAELLRRHPLKTNLGHADAIAIALSDEHPGATRFESAESAFLTTKREPLARESKGTQVKAMTAAGEARFLDLHRQISTALLNTIDTLRAHQTLALSRAWFTAGQRLLEHVQRIKEERRELDFNDLEWKTFTLLTESDNAHWVQYKLDQRIDHLLIDEFQDTNPVQWRMLYPLLQELASAPPERARSVFLVGDEKQSIYRFRRADPRLFATAQDWMREHLRAAQFPLDASWRSAPAIIDVVNAAFAQPPLSTHYPTFPQHRTHRGELWGRVELLPLIARPESSADTDASSGEFRNPLRAPRAEMAVDAHDDEARQIAARIQQLVHERLPVGTPGAARPVDYRDILILLREGTHTAAYESALRAAGIPYAGLERRTLLNSLEVADIVALLNLLVTPFDNLALAQVLRSPLFACTEADLECIALAASVGTWHERLATVATTLPPEHTLALAQQLLQRWHEYAATLPVHDLLDRIYTEGDVLERYRASVAPHLREQVAAHLVRLVELALELDSGRYPSLGGFIARIAEARAGRDDGLDADSGPTAVDGVRVLTIHRAKGLEAPVVFLANAGARERNSASFHALVDWHPAHARPQRFYLAGKASEFDAVSRTMHAQHLAHEQREEANLLYVALTRARQLLVVSGCAAHSGNTGWYGIVQDAIRRAAGCAEAVMHENGQRPAVSAAAAALTAAPDLAEDARLRSRISAPAPETEIAPSRARPADEPRDTHVEPDAQERGLIIHRLLQLLTDPQPAPTNIIRHRVAAQFGRAPDDPDLLTWLREAEGVVAHPALRGLFDPTRYQRAWNEVPLTFDSGRGTVHGIIDRLIVDDSGILLVDYKTHRVGGHEELDTLARVYREQLQWYAQGAARAWPDKTIRAALVFTALPTAVEVSV